MRPPHNYNWSWPRGLYSVNPYHALHDPVIRKSVLNTKHVNQLTVSSSRTSAARSHRVDPNVPESRSTAESHFALPQPFAAPGSGRDMYFAPDSRSRSESCTYQAPVSGRDMYSDSSSSRLTWGPSTLQQNRDAWKHVSSLTPAGSSSSHRLVPKLTPVLEKTTARYSVPKHLVGDRKPWAVEWEEITNDLTEQEYKDRTDRIGTRSFHYRFNHLYLQRNASGRIGYDSSHWLHVQGDVEVWHQCNDECAFTTWGVDGRHIDW